ncbi:hypothetical protein B0J18DRAFT_476821 [Chaetomium sp. MPI-SDFR-AT-0129]|nr:hypothetical protein B0J18DRAFT_476821 [Chaetomium sp. MPI-SDFR-AT-0129]
MEALPQLPPNYAAAIELIDAAHEADPRPAPGPAILPVPYELHYARKMTRWLALREPEASPALQVACRAQHFRRWQLPRSSYPQTRAGYLTWRAKQKSLAATELTTLLSSPQIQPPLPPDDIARIAALVRKEGLVPSTTATAAAAGKESSEPTTATKESDEETQALEDVACLVFLDDQFDEFESRSEISEDKVVGILKKTWGKMSGKGRQLALGMELSERATGLIGRVLEGGV